MLRIKRTYDPPARGDGRRILVERLWPRGMKKDAVAAAAWMKEVAPSAELRQWFGTDGSPLGRESRKRMSTQAKSPTHSLKLKRRSEVADRTLEFQFERPPGMTFKAGQFLDLTLIDPPETDAEGNTRAFSINSAPDDPDLTFTTRLRDTAFKRVLQTMPLGTEVEAEGPFGNLTLHNDASRPAVLLAGGIGVTPFRSIARRAAHEKLSHRIFLFYSNRRPEDAPFLDEFRGLARDNPNFTFVPTMTQMSDSHLPWKGETAYIDHELIVKHLLSNTPPASAATRPVYYIAGPPQMVAGLRAMLNTASIDDDDIRTEDFTGY